MSSRLYAWYRSPPGSRGAASWSTVHFHGEAQPRMASSGPQVDRELERRISARLLDVLIRAGLIAVLAALCYSVFAPFLTLTAWAIILAIKIYPLERSLARKIGGRQGQTATIILTSGTPLIVVHKSLSM